MLGQPELLETLSPKLTRKTSSREDKGRKETYGGMAAPGRTAEGAATGSQLCKKAPYNDQLGEGVKGVGSRVKS